ncbi:MAG TPA: hypothetical protein VNK91_02060 [Burkholderiaceae bacterium]|nr:hypothetical protein [Burkholderiaceae bacterium]
MIRHLLTAIGLYGLRWSPLYRFDMRTRKVMLVYPGHRMGWREAWTQAREFIMSIDKFHHDTRRCRRCGRNAVLKVDGRDTCLQCGGH